MTPLNLGRTSWKTQMTRNPIEESIHRRGSLSVKPIAVFAVVAALAFAGCGGASHEESALEKSVNAVFDENQKTMARYCTFHVNVIDKGMYDATFFQSDVRAFEENVGSKLLREYHEHGVTPESLVKGINRRCERSSGDRPETKAATQSSPSKSISQLQREAAAQHGIAQDYLRQNMQIVRAASKSGAEYLNDDEQQRVESLIRLQNEARQHAAALHAQLCERVLQIPDVLPGNGELAQIAYSCERQGFR